MTSSSSLEISVIVPTYNRKNTLLPLLDTLLRQTLPMGDFEVIVSCDGSTDGTIEEVRALESSNPRLKLLVQSNGGPAAARNRAAKAARGRFLAFTDDDCLAMPGWLAAVVAPFADPAIVAVQGRTTTNRAEVTPLTHQMVSHGSTAMPTCNAACRHDAFEKLGGFYEGFPYPHNEDADLAWRLERLGKIHYSPDAWILHPPRPESFMKKARWVRYLESEFPLYRRNPEIYRRYRSASPWRTIYWRVFTTGQFWELKSACRYLVKPFQPKYFFVGVGLVFARWTILLARFPHFLRAARQ